MFLHNSFSHNRLEQNELDLPQAKFGFWVKLNYALDKGFWSVRPRRGNSMQKMLPLLDSILIPYHRDHRGLRAMISLSV
jgi:hypothetical protein